MDFIAEGVGGFDAYAAVDSTVAPGASFWCCCWCRWGYRKNLVVVIVVKNIDDSKYVIVIGIAGDVWLKSVDGTGGRTICMTGGCRTMRGRRFGGSEQWG